MHKAFIKSALIVALLFVAALTARAAEWQYDGVSRVVAIADVHGAYDAMVQALLAADVVDKDLAWSAGDAHLVIVGDILDRGPNSRPAMDLLMQLEAEAEARGGKVHVLIGNHEAMNLSAIFAMFPRASMQPSQTRSGPRSVSDGSPRTSGNARRVIRAPRR